MKSDTLIALAYTGDHYKVREGHIPQIPHQEMLLTAIKNINPDNEFDVLVSANKFSIMDIANDTERYHIWKVVKLATVLSMRENHGHQMGQAWAIRQAIEYAKTIGYEYLFWSAEDILYDDPFIVRNSIIFLRNGASYIGRYWGNPSELNCQVFGCRVSVMYNLFKPQDFAHRGGIIEAYMSDVLRNEPKVIQGINHHHEHNPSRFFNLIPHVVEQNRLYRDREVL